MSKRQDWRGVHEAASAAGEAAAEQVVPDAIRVVQRVNPFDDSSAVVRDYGVVEGGVCGFAWVTVVPGTGSFARWLKQNRGARRGYDGGVQFSVRAYGQSMQRKEAYAQAYAAKARELVPGLRVYGESRMD